ncbi:MAG: YcaO-like family protein [Candidatus Heimdallarchaeota archaeon]|nr:YcaO-like family protein [Candidatus Heimdallarchaeota archaeon]
MSFQISHSMRDAKTLKCSKPENTIKHLEECFEKLGFNFTFSVKEFSKKINIYSGYLEIPKLGIYSNGKGLSSELAKASALAEMVERICAGTFFNETNFLRSQSLHDDDFHKLLSDISILSNMSFIPGYVFSSEEDLKNAFPIEELINHSPFFTKKIIQELKQNDYCKHWIDGYSLLSEEKVKLPLKFIKAISGSNGLAAGNTIEEAIVQASCEIFERYVCINTLRSKKILPTININTIPFKSVRRIINELRKKNIRVIVKDFSFDGLFPCYGMLFINDNIKKTKNPIKKVWHYKSFRVGSSFNAEEALLRCFTEYLQGKSLINITKRNYYDIYWNNFLKNIDSSYNPPINYLSIFRKYYYSGDLSFLEEGKITDFQQSELSFDCYEEIQHVKEICSKLATEVFVVNLTNTAFSFPVVRVVIPKISDTLSYYNENQPDIILNLIQDSPKNLYKSLEISEKYYLSSTWLTDDKALQALTEELIENMKNTLTFEHSPSIPLLNHLNAFHLLACIYYRLQDFRNYSSCMLILSNLYPNMRKQFLYLSLLAKYNQMELVKMQKGVYAQSDLFFNDLNPKNPFIEWFEELNTTNSEKERIINVKRLVDIFL